MNPTPKVWTAHMVDELCRTRKTSVVLHTTEGPVRTTYGPGCEVHAQSLILQYLQDGKNFSVEQHTW